MIFSNLNMTNEAKDNSKFALLRCESCATLNRVDLARASDKPKCAKCATPIPLDHPLSVTDADFQQIVDGSSVPVLVDFYADWCGPCKAMQPTLDTFAANHAGEVLVLKMDTDANPLVSARFGIRSIPTLISFRDGKESKKHVGAADRTKLRDLVA